jgi:hypothetical protein
MVRSTGIVTRMEGSSLKGSRPRTTRSASLPASMDPTSAAMPWEMAGLIVYLAT